MRKWLDNNDILMYSIHNEAKSVVARRFIKTLKVKISEKMIANDSKSYLGYLNKLVDVHNNTYHGSVSKKPIDAGYSVLTKEIELSNKAP